LINLKEYEARHREFIKNSGDIFENGYSSYVVYEAFTIQACSLQPETGYTLNTIPEGYRTKGVYSFWTTTPVRTLEQGTDQLSDQIKINGQWFSILRSQPWVESDFLPHYDCIAVREDQNNSPTQSPEGGNFG
jgi:hypothetical protein